MRAGEAYTYMHACTAGQESVQTREGGRTNESGLVVRVRARVRVRVGVRVRVRARVRVRVRVSVRVRVRVRVKVRVKVRVTIFLQQFRVAGVLRDGLALKFR